MTHMVRNRLIPMTSSVISHGLQKAANRFLVKLRNASVLINQFFFSCSKHLSERRRSTSRQHESCIYTMLFECCHISKVERIRSLLIVFLRAPADAKKLSKLCLI